MSFTLPLNELLTIDMPVTLKNYEAVQEYLMESCQREIWEVLCDLRRSHPEYRWDQWMVHKGEGPVVGRWPIRMKKIFRIHHPEICLPPQTSACIGERLASSNHTKTVYMEIVDEIQWKMGAFGDGYSCWWDANHISYRFREYLFRTIKRGRALKFFASPAAYEANKLAGTGRCWMAIEKEYGYLWNGRGGGMTTRLAAEALATHLRCKYENDNFRIKGSYLDDGGYVVGVPPFPPRGMILDFNLPPECVYPGY